MKKTVQYRNLLREELMADIDGGHVEVADAIRRFRKILGLTQSEFAKFQGVSFNLVKQVENNRGNPTLAMIEKLLRGSGLGLKIGRKDSQNLTP